MSSCTCCSADSGAHALALQPTVAARRKLVNHSVTPTEPGGACVPGPLQVKPHVFAPIVGSDESEAAVRQHALHHSGLFPPRHLFAGSVFLVHSKVQTISRGGRKSRTREAAQRARTR